MTTPWTREEYTSFVYIDHKDYIDVLQGPLDFNISQVISSVLGSHNRKKKED